MDVAQMLAHCNVTYEMVYEDKHPKPNFLMKFFLKSFIKNTVTNEKPYKRNSQTAPAFLVKSTKDFEAEKKRLIGYITKTQQLGEIYFGHKESHSFGRLTKEEWNNMFYKHLDHHLHQLAYNSKSHSLSSIVIKLPFSPDFSSLISVINDCPKIFSSPEPAPNAGSFFRAKRHLLSQNENRPCQNENVSIIPSFFRIKHINSTS